MCVCVKCENVLERECRQIDLKFKTEVYANLSLGLQLPSRKAGQQRRRHILPQERLLGKQGVIARW